MNRAILPAEIQEMMQQYPELVAVFNLGHFRKKNIIDMVELPEGLCKEIAETILQKLERNGVVKIGPHGHRILPEYKGILCSR